MTELIEMIRWQRYPLPSGAASSQVNLTVGEVGTGKPVALVTAGVHGDEGPWGAWAIRKLLETTPVEALRGTLRVVPAANPLAMEADARNAPPDTLDLNRVFPGDAKGSHTERLAALLVEHAVTGADTVIDLHGGGSWCVNAFAFAFAGSEALSKAFNPPFLVTAPDRTVTLTGYARSKGAQVAAVEMGGKSHFENLRAEQIASGLRRALGIAGVLSPVYLPAARQPVPVGATEVLRPSCGGVFEPVVREGALGTLVKQGTLLGVLRDSATMEMIEEFRAPFSQTALLLLRPTLTRIEGGAMTYVIAEPR